MSRRLTYSIIFLASLLALTACKNRQISNGAEGNLSKDAYLYNSALFVDAKRAIYAGDAKEAEKLLQEILQKDPKHHAAYFEWSKLLAKDRLPEAILKAEKSTELAPENQWYWENLARLHEKNNDYAAMGAAWEHVVALQAEDLSQYYTLANIYLQAKDWVKAIEVLNRIEKKFGYSPNLSLQRQKVYQQTKDYKSSLKEMEKLVKAYPQDQEYMRVLADLLLKMNREEEALSYYTKILELNPNNGNVHLTLANYYSNKNELKKSFYSLEQAFNSDDIAESSKVQIMMNIYNQLQKDSTNDFLESESTHLMGILQQKYPKSPGIKSLQADFLTRKKMWVEARSAYEEVLEMDSTKYLVWEQIILINRELGDFKSMEEYSYRALNLFPQFPIVYYFNALANMELGYFKKADANLNLGLSFVYKDPQKVEFYTLMGQVRDSLGRGKEAEISYQKALLLNPNYVPALSRLALHYALLHEQISDGMSLAKKALELDMNNVEAMHAYALLLYSNNQKSEAKNWLEKALELQPKNKSFINLKKQWEN